MGRIATGRTNYRKQITNTGRHLDSIVESILDAMTQITNMEYIADFESLTNIELNKLNRIHDSLEKQLDKVCQIRLNYFLNS